MFCGGLANRVVPRCVQHMESLPTLMDVTMPPSNELQLPERNYALPTHPNFGIFITHEGNDEPNTLPSL